MAQAKNIFGPKVGFDEQFDSRLMNPDKSTDEKVAAFNEAKRKSLSKRKERTRNETQDDNQEEAPTLREAVLAKKRDEAAKQMVQEKVGAMSNASLNPVGKWSSKMLQASWRALIPSFGTTLLWINIHVFLSLVLGKKFFCSLGDEWTMGLPLISGEEGGGLKGAIGGCAKNGEKWAFTILDLILLAVIGCIIGIISLLVRVVSNPLEIVDLAIGWIWNGAGISIGK